MMLMMCADGAEYMVGSRSHTHCASQYMARGNRHIFNDPLWETGFCHTNIAISEQIINIKVNISSKAICNGGGGSGGGAVM